MVRSNETAAQIISLLQANGPMKWIDLVPLIGVTISQVSRAAKYLQMQGRIKQRRVKGRVTYSLIDSSMNHLQARLGASEDNTPPDLLERIGMAVEFRRKERKLTQTDLARRTGMTRPGVSKLENGGLNPTIKQLDKIAKALGVKVVDLLS